MSTNPTTTDTLTKAEAALQRAKDRVANRQRKTEGSVPEMMLAAGFSADQVRRAVHLLTVECQEDMVLLVGQKALDAMTAQVDQAILMA